MNCTTGGCIEQQIWSRRCQSINLRKRCGCMEARVTESRKWLETTGMGRLREAKEHYL
jgi:hypothetical protein